MAEAQSYRNHARFDPPFHFFVAPVLLINVLVTLAVLILHWPFHLLLHGWLFILAIALLLTAGVARSSALRAQDRLIRLEESLRYARLLSPEDLVSAQALTLKQIIALRFAGDAEVGALVRRALSENLAPKAIKQSIQEWRTDPYRV